ncbi:MAG: acyl carrier protein [Gemmatimonadales bacterium]|nr:acyl carrier protein [Gemmatimonadales bacterium]
MTHGAEVSQVDQLEVLNRVRGFVRENFLYASPHVQLADSDQLLAAGIVDSMGVIEMLEFLQQEFGLTIPDDDVTEANLGSLSAIAEYVVAHREPPGLVAG